MAKYYNNKIKTGRVAGSVFSVRFGEVIERAYNPIVNNPNTPSQIEARAKLKLMSQLSAVFAPVIAMPRQGAVSARNLFTRENYRLATFTGDNADIAMTSVKLTKSVVGLPNINATRSSFDISVNLQLPDNDISRVVYVAVVRQQDGTARIAATAVASVPGTDNSYQATLNVGSTAQAYVYAYGVRDNTEAARVKFENMTVTAENMAEIITSRMLTDADITVTETQAVLVPVQA